MLDNGPLSDLLAKTAPQAIINAAGANLPTWQRDREAGRRANVELPVAIAAAAHARGLPLTHISCKSVYGRQDSAALREDTLAQPETTFGQEVLEAERRLGGLARLGLDVRIVRACAVYGPAPLRNPSISNRRFAAVLANLLAKGEVELIGSFQDSTNEYLFVDDFAVAVGRIARGQPPAERAPAVFNVGSGRLTGLVELALCLRWLFPGGRVRLRPLPAEFDTVLPPLEVRRVAETFGWRPRTRLRHGLRAFLGDLA